MKPRTEQLRFGVFVSGEEVFGRRSALADIARLLGAVERGHATAWITSLCNLYQPGEPATIFAVDRKASEILLSPDLRQRVEVVSQNAGGRITFHRPQMLLGLQLAQRLCADGPAALEPRDAVAELWRIGEALIRISDFLNRDMTPNPDWKETAAVLLPIYVEGNPPGTLLSVRRTYRMLSDPLWESDPRLVAAASRFVSTVGFSPRDYMMVILGFVTKAMGRRELATDTSLRMREVFSRARDADAIRRVVDSLSTPYASLPRLVAEPERIVRDKPFEPFRSRPLIDLGNDRFWVADLSFLNERMLSGVFWALMGTSSTSERNQLIPAWGDLFESYVNRRLAAALGARYLESPLNKNGDQITDAVVIEKPALVLLECKASLMKESAKYGQKFGPVMEELKKFVKNGQLGRAAVRLLRDRRDLIGDSKPKIFPVIISLDHSVAAPFLARAMNETLRSSCIPSGTEAVFERLTVLSADDAENMLRFIADGKKLRNILRESHAGDPDGSNTFHNYLAGLAADDRVFAGKSPDEFREPFDAAKAFWLAQGGDDLFASM